jgi:hypothetical protein
MARTCPNCHSPELATIEQLLGSAPVTVDDDGAEHWHNSTDVHWDTSTSIGVTCRSCGWRYEGLDYIEKLKREG